MQLVKRRGTSMETDSKLNFLKLALSRHNAIVVITNVD